MNKQFDVYKYDFDIEGNVYCELIDPAKYWKMGKVGLLCRIRNWFRVRRNRRRKIVTRSLIDFMLADMGGLHPNSIGEAKR